MINAISTIALALNIFLINVDISFIVCFIGGKIITTDYTLHLWDIWNLKNYFHLAQSVLSHIFSVSCLFCLQLCIYDIIMVIWVHDVILMVWREIAAISAAVWWV